MLHSKQKFEAGLSLFETLIALAILGLALSISMLQLRQPSPEMRVQSALAELRLDISTVRLRAIQSRTSQSLNLGNVVCRGYPTNIEVFASGNIRESETCLIVDGNDIRFGLNQRDGVPYGPL